MLVSSIAAGGVACLFYYNMGSWSTDDIPDVEEPDKLKGEKETKRDKLKKEDPTEGLSKWEILYEIYKEWVLYAKPWRLVVIVILQLIVASGEMATPYYIGKVFDSLRRGDKTEDTLPIVHCLLMTIVVRQFGYMFRRKIRRDAVRLYQTCTQAAVLRRVTLLELAFFDRTTTGELVHKIGQVKAMEGVMYDIVDSAQSVLFLVGTGCVMCVMSRWLGLLCFCMVLVSWLWTSFGPITVWHTHGKKICKLSRQMPILHTEAMSMIRTIKGFGVEDEINDVYYKAQMDYKKGDFVWHTWWAVNDFGWDLWGRLTTVATVWLATVYFVPYNVLTIGELYTIIMYEERLGGNFSRIGHQYAEFLEKLSKGRQYLSLKLREGKIKDDGKHIPRVIHGKVQFRDVDFQYPNREEDIPVLQKFNLKVEPGKVVALVGHSGCGKTTVLKLIQRMYEPDKGGILIDDVPLAEWDHKAMVTRTRGLSIVEQDPGLFAKTIKENIICGLKQDNITMDDVIRSAKQANAHGFITDLPNGYNSLVGERGVMLSGGQKQRICIARALLRNPRILLLDEATSSLDSESEAMVQEAIDRSMVGRTVIVVAHRLSTVRNADCIYVMKPGEGIVEHGTHDELLLKNGEYARFVRKQLVEATAMAEPDVEEKCAPTPDDIAGGAWNRPPLATSASCPSPDDKRVVRSRDKLVWAGEAAS